MPISDLDHHQPRITINDHGVQVVREPVDISFRRPPKNKQASCKEWCTDHHWWQACFGDGSTFVCLKSANETALVENVDGGATKCADEDSEKWERGYHWVPLTKLEAMINTHVAQYLSNGRLAE
jgi:hypothetical protein